MKVSEILEGAGIINTRLVESVTPQQVQSLLGQEVVIDYISTKPVTLGGGKKNPMQGRVTKINRNWPVRFTKPGDYETEMRQQPGQEEFKAKQNYGTYTENGLIEKDGKLMVQVIGVGKPEVTYLLDGQPISKEEIIDLKPSAPRPEGQVPVFRLEIDKIQVVKA